MTDRSHGYLESVGYTSNFFAELAPNWLDFCVRLNGFEAPGSGPSYRYLDLGCGQGYHLCTLAAANSGAEFIGVDFSHQQIANARALAAEAGLSNVKFVEADFNALAAAWPEALGQFDYVVLQGILSWIPADVRQAVYRCIANASRPGTLAYFGYNAQPGWLSALPFQHVARELSGRHGPEAAIDGAVHILEQLRKAEASLFVMQPGLATRLDAIGSHPKNYLIHEYLPDGWTPLWHSEVARELRSAEFEFVGSATIGDSLLPEALTPALCQIVKEQADPAFRQDVQSLAIHEVFRRDIFCRTPQAAGAEPASLLRTPIHLAADLPEGQPARFKTSFGVLTREYASFADILGCLMDGPKSFAELLALENPARPNTQRLLTLMLDARILRLGTSYPGSSETAERFNAAAARRVVNGHELRQAAAAAYSTGIPFSELEFLLMDTWIQAKGEAEERAMGDGVVQRLANLGRQLQFAGQPVPPDQLEEQKLQLGRVFNLEVLPRWRRLGVVR